MENTNQDEHAGKGGSYVKEADGKRVLQERTDHPSAGSGQAQSHAQQTEPGSAAATGKKSTKVKGANNA